MTARLGFGLMRLPLTDPDDGGSVDIDLCCRMADKFIESGFTYFDTALMYCNGKSEEAVKKILTERLPRDSYTLATKLHGAFFDTREDIDRVFEGQRQKTGADYFDYYLLHDVGVDHYRKYNELGCWEWLSGLKEKGLAGNIGFSFHDSPELLDKVLTEHPEVDFVQLQINYLDWDNGGVRSRECYETARKHGKPVIVMEPVKGGTLANVPPEVEKLFKEKRPDLSVASWAIRFAASLPGVMVVLSGMSNMEQMEDNLSYMNGMEPLSGEEQEIIRSAVGMINSNIAIACTGCSYCTEGCPMDIPIPKYFALYNAEKSETVDKGWSIHNEYYERMAGVSGKASDCVECGQCEAICPQHLGIIDCLKDVAAVFEQ